MWGQIFILKVNIYIPDSKGYFLKQGREEAPLKNRVPNLICKRKKAAWKCRVSSRALGVEKASVKSGRGNEKPQGVRCGK